jgi:biotin carboxyl carrier protein
VGVIARLEDGVSATKVTRVGDGVFAVEIGDRREIVYAARTPAGRVAFCNGEVFHEGAAKRPDAAGAASHKRPAASAGPALPMTAPMPATVTKVLVEPGAAVKKGDTLIILEAMKMELPLRASADGTVAAVHCRAGQLVQPDAVLIDLA